MSQQVQELIDKIKLEGVEAANKEAHQINHEARQKADQILIEAKRKSEHMLLEANQEIKKMRESAEKSLKQSSRDMILSLRQNIQNVLKRIVEQEVSEALKPEQLAQIIERVIEKALDQKTHITSVEVVLNARDLEHLKKGFILKLQKKIKEPIEFKASDDIGKGFTISFDGGKSGFDFSDASLANYLGNFLNVQVAQLVKDSV